MQAAREHLPVRQHASHPDCRATQGVDIRISMFDVMADWLTVPLLNAEAGKPPRRLGLSHPSIAPYGVFSAADGRQVLISIQSEREWLVFCRDVLGDAGLSEDPRFVTNVARVAHRTETDALVVGAFALIPGDVLVARLTKADIAFAELNDMAALSRHPQLRRVSVMTEAGPVSFPAPGATVYGDARTYGPVPALGAHTATVLAEFTPEELDAP